MRGIQRGPAPRVLVDRCRLPRELGGTYEALEKPPVIEALLRDQGYLCGFCMGQVELFERDATGAVCHAASGQPRRKRAANGTDWPWKIAHWAPQSVAPDRHLDWDNMVGACRGNDLEKGRPLTCDSRQKDQELKVHPYKPATVAQVRGRSRARSVGYELYSDDPVIDGDLRARLGLNDGYLPDNRQAVLNEFRKELQRKLPSHAQLAADEKRARVRAVYDEWRWEDRASGRLRPYCGVVEVYYKLSR